MKNFNIHPTAIVEEGAQIGKNVTIEPYAVIKSTVVLEDDVTIKSHAYIDGYTTIGQGSVIWPSASIGTKSQDLKFKGEKTFVTIGKNCDIREFVTINSSTGEGSSVKVGDNCLIMAYCHIAHNCEVGNRVIMSNMATLAGHVTVDDNAVIGGMAAVHQFTRVGKHAMVGGMSRVAHDVPPFMICGGVPFKLGGINLVGLKRHNFSYEVRKALSLAFKLIYRSSLNLSDALIRIENELSQYQEVMHLVNFCKSSQRGLIGLNGITKEEPDSLES